MGSKEPMTESFRRRVNRIPGLGLGLSVDVYSPNLFELTECMEKHGLRPAYLEVFKATESAVRAVKRAYPSVPLPYHGEGLWIISPDFPEGPTFEDDLTDTAAQLTELGSPWLTHECAAKQMAGYWFGTYLPPLYTPESAEVVADHIALVQRRLDQTVRAACRPGPLFLLEMPPLTYFAAGTISIPDFFRLVTERVACGLVLDVGHLWTVYRYTAACRGKSLERFVQEFLDSFPMERVVEVHVAGLAQHEAVAVASPGDELPLWIDTHAAPIPPVLLTMLEQVLGHPRLVSLRGVALEVDTKPIELIVEEFQTVSRRCSKTIRRRLTDWPATAPSQAGSAGPTTGRHVPSGVDRTRLAEDYELYARMVSRGLDPDRDAWKGGIENRDGIELYAGRYLPHEILHWGGDLEHMFPDSCRGLVESGLSLKDFVSWWVGAPYRFDHPYDFFLLKIDRFLAFVDEKAAGLRLIAEREAEVLRRGYAEAGEVLGAETGSMR
jgi:hypothetical protein